jgi:arsenate reductase
MVKKILVLCTGNSCRSIIAEALVNAKLDGIEAKSSGVKASGKVNPNAKRLLEEKGIWKDEYHSKTLDEVINDDFDLVVTVCDNAKETCPIFPRPIPKIHVGFEDPDGKGYEAFLKTYKDIQEELLPRVQEFFFEQARTHSCCNPSFLSDISKKVTATETGIKINFKGAVQKDKIFEMVQNCQTGKCECMAEETKAKISDMNVSGENGDVEVILSGDISKEEIEEALSKSKVLN